MRKEAYEIADVRGQRPSQAPCLGGVRGPVGNAGRRRGALDSPDGARRQAVTSVPAVPVAEEKRKNSRHITTGSTGRSVGQETKEVNDGTVTPERPSKCA